MQEYLSIGLAEPHNHGNSALGLRGMLEASKGLPGTGGRDLVENHTGSRKIVRLS